MAEQVSEPKIKKKHWQIDVLGEALTTFYGPRPGNEEGEGTIMGDVKKPKTPPSVLKLMQETTKDAAEKYLQLGEIDKAFECIAKLHKMEQGEYDIRYKVFNKAKNNGYFIPFMGAYCVLGALRTGATDLFQHVCFTAKGKKGAYTKHSPDWLKAWLIVTPYHINLFRPDLKKGEMITAPDRWHEQHPTPKVQAFNWFEAIDPPFQFQFSITMRKGGPFDALLMDEKKMLTVLHQSVHYGLCGGRGFGGGHWRIISYKVKYSPPDF